MGLEGGSKGLTHLVTVSALEGGDLEEKVERPGLDLGIESSEHAARLLHVWALARTRGPVDDYMARPGYS